MKIGVNAGPVLSIDETKVDRYRATLGLVQQDERVSTLTQGPLRQLVGQLGFLARAVRWGRLFLRSLHSVLTSAGDGAFDMRPGAHVTLTEEARSDLRWWGELMGSPTSPWRGRTQWASTTWALAQGYHFLEQGGDASGEGGAHEAGGWGAVMGYDRAWGYFPAAQRDWHIGVKEMIAVHKGLVLWQAQYAGHRVVVHTDNAEVVAGLNHGTVRSPQTRAVLREIARLAVDMEIDIRARHIAGALNITADDLSRGRGRASTCSYHYLHYNVDCDPPAEIDTYADQEFV